MPTNPTEATSKAIHITGTSCLCVWGVRVIVRVASVRPALASSFSSASTLPYPLHQVLVSTQVIFRTTPPPPPPLYLAYPLFGSPSLTSFMSLLSSMKTMRRDTATVRNIRNRVTCHTHTIRLFSLSSKAPRIPIRGREGQGVRVEARC